MGRILVRLAALAISIAVLSIGTFAADAAGRNWPQWRGPLANGVSPSGDPPVNWSESENIRFKVPIPGTGLASPIVWDDRVFVLTAVPADAAAYESSVKGAVEKQEAGEWPPSVDPVKQRFVVLALSRKDGRVLWEKTVAEKVPHESHYVDSSWASASPITDGKILFAHFGSNGLYALDLDGNLLWQTDLGDMTVRRGFGEGSSPALHGDTLVVNWDHEGDSFIVALDKKTGERKWKVDRPDEVTSWSTPLIVEKDGRAQVVVAATGHSRGYDLATGKEIWRVGGMTVNVIPSPVHRDGVVYLTSGFRGNALQAVDLGTARGSLDGSDAMLWTHDRHTPYVPSTLLYDDRLYMLKHFKNILSCLDADTGKVVYTEQRVEGIDSVYASPVGAAGRVYVVGRNGTTAVLKHGDEYEVLALNTLDEGIDASPAIAGDELFLRGRKHLYRIASKDAGGKAPGKQAKPAPSGAR